MIDERVARGAADFASLALGCIVASPLALAHPRQSESSIGLLDRTCGPPRTGRLAPREVAQERPVELPGAKFLDRRVRVGERAVGDAQEIERAINETPFGRAAHMRITVVGQRNGTVDAAG